jgi:hypothetical protein
LTLAVVGFEPSKRQIFKAGGIQSCPAL